MFDGPTSSSEFQRLVGKSVGRVKTQQAHWDFYIVEQICPRKSHWELVDQPATVKQALDMC
jgi:hypothetical protein